MGVEEWLFLDWIALGSCYVSPGNQQRATVVVADFADARLAFGDGATVSAGEAADAVVLEFFVEAGIGFLDLLVEDAAEGAHGVSASILTLRKA
jgi:hypothetical protein